MDQPQLTRTDVIKAIENSAGIQNAAEVMPYIGGADNPYRSRVMAAIAAGDGHALGTYCAHAVNAALCRAGFKDRKSTRLNSSHVAISYAVFCLKKKNSLLRRATSAT